MLVNAKEMKSLLPAKSTTISIPIYVAEKTYSLK